MIYLGQKIDAEGLHPAEKRTVMIIIILLALQAESELLETEWFICKHFA